jgi:peroxiredoxin
VRVFQRIIVFILFAVFPMNALAVGPEIYQQYGLQALTPPVEAAPLDANAVNAGIHTLQQHRGEWVLLTFFATWCGPCMTEMPALQSLHETLEGEAFVVLGVSVDDTLPPLDRWLKKKVVTFPIVHDANKSAEKVYNASSIPLSYLINPDGEVVAMAKGARDWSRTLPLFQTLLGLEVSELPDINAPLAVGSAPSGSVSLPSTVLVGESFDLVVEVSWTGQIDDYFLLPPRVGVPLGVTRSASTVTTTGEDTSSTLTYRYALIAEEAGELDFPAVMVRYQPIAGGAEGNVAVSVERVLVLAAQNEPNRFYFMLAGVVGVFMFLILLFRKRPIKESLL